MQDTINVYRYNQLTSQNLLVPKLNSIAVIADLYNYIYRMHIVNYYSIKQFMHAVSYLALAGIEMSQYNYIALLRIIFTFSVIVTHTTQNVFHTQAEPEIQNQQKLKISKKNLETQLLIALLLCAK